MNQFKIFNKYAEIPFGHPSFSPEDKTEKVITVKVKLSELRQFVAALQKIDPAGGPMAGEHKLF